MKRYARLMFAFGILSLLIVFSATSATCWQAPAGPAPGAFGPPSQDLMIPPPQGPLAGPPMGPPAGPPMGPPPMMGGCPPPACGPGPMTMCPPPSCGPTFSFELGGRATLAICDMEYVTDNFERIYFQRDLNFKDVLALGEVYAAVRIAPRIAFTYSFVVPTLDTDYGWLFGQIQLGNQIFNPVLYGHFKTETSAHRFEGEYFFLTGCNYRLGAYALGELIVNHVEFTFPPAAATVQADDTLFLLGFGGSAEYAFSDNMFLRAKAAYTFLEETTYGAYAEVSARMFPDMNNGCEPQPVCGSGDLFSGLRPYGEVGYRYRVIEWDLGTNAQGQQRTFFTQFHGPFAAIGAIF